MQPPSRTTPADVDLRSTESVAQSLSTIKCNVSTSFQGSSFNVHSRVPMKYQQMRSALCMSRAEGFPHSSGTSLDTELNVWAFSGEEHHFAHNCSVLTVFSWTKQRFLIRNSRFRSHTRRMHRISILHTSTGQQTVEEFCKWLDQKSPVPS